MTENMTKQYLLRMPPSLYRRLENVAMMRRVSLSVILRQACYVYLEQFEGEDGE